MNDCNISCLIISYNEEKNMRRTLDSIKWCKDVLVIDSGSEDKTVDIIRSYSNTRLLRRKFDTFAKQCNYGLEHITSPWVLSLDSDYIVTKELLEEIKSLVLEQGHSGPQQNGYYIPFRYCINGRPIRSGLLPPRISLYRRESARYVDVGHSHRIRIQGEIGRMTCYLLHDDRKSMWVWLCNQKRYQSIEAEMLKNTRSSLLPLQDKVRKHTCFAPFLVFIICIIIRGGVLDGKEGFIYAFQRLIAESLLFLELHLERGTIEE